MMWPQDKSLLELIERAANAGLPCPSNLDIARAYGTSISYAPKVLHRLARAGAISVERGTNARVVTIIATGKRTAGEITSRHWCDLPSDMLPPIVRRDPCPRCGARADIGCAHGHVRLASASMSL